MKKFNVTGKCIPELHYMVNIDKQLETIEGMVAKGEYFCINRGRQYGKTTTFSLLKRRLEKQYIVFSISLEGISQGEGKDLPSLASFIFGLLADAVDYNEVVGADKSLSGMLTELGTSSPGVRETANAISQIVSCAGKPVVLLIDEVDQAGNYESFIQLLGILRDKYLKRDTRPTFRSVILAGVYDIKNLKLKLRSDEQHQYNSPWNIAVDFTYDMSLSQTGIRDMLVDYGEDKGLCFDAALLAGLLREYTQGYPYLVSRLCQIIDENDFAWNKKGFLQAVNCIFKESNTLFDDITKKISQFPELKSMLQAMLYEGKQFAYNIYDSNMQLAGMFGYIRDDNGWAVVANRIFETWMYNLFAMEEGTKESIYGEAAQEKNQFIQAGRLDMERVLERFVVHFQDIYSEKDDKFVENMGRKLFLLYLRPIINGVGNYYVEAQTRDATRTDVIVDYAGVQYIVELKIWRGNEYNAHGEKQLAEYLDYYHADKGYLVSFSFNKSKKAGLTHKMILGKSIVEAIV